MNNNLYQRDFYAWTYKNAELLKRQAFDQIDVEHIIEELESMGRAEKREIISRLSILIAHLLKWEYQPERRSKSWELTIIEQRSEIIELLEDSPSLKMLLEQDLHKAYTKAVLLAARETGISRDKFNTQPLTLNQYLDNNFIPDKSK